MNVDRGIHKLHRKNSTKFTLSAPEHDAKLHTRRFLLTSILPLKKPSCIFFDQLTSPLEVALTPLCLCNLLASVSDHEDLRRQDRVDRLIF